MLKLVFWLLPSAWMARRLSILGNGPPGPEVLCRAACGPPLLFLWISTRLLPFPYNISSQRAKSGRQPR